MPPTVFCRRGQIFFCQLQKYLYFCTLETMAMEKHDIHNSLILTPPQQDCLSGETLSFSKSES